MKRRVVFAALSALGLMVATAGTAQADSAIRGAFAEVRPNGSAQAASFEHVLPDNFYFGSTLDEAGALVGVDTLPTGTAFDDGAGVAGGARIGTALFIENTDAGLNTSSIRSLLIQAGPAISTSNDFTNTAIDAPRTLESAIAEQVQTLTPTEEDVTGLVRAFVGADGFSADASLD